MTSPGDTNSGTVGASGMVRKRNGRAVMDPIKAAENQMLLDNICNNFAKLRMEATAKRCVTIRPNGNATSRDSRDSTCSAILKPEEEVDNHEEEDEYRAVTEAELAELQDEMQELRREAEVHRRRSLRVRTAKSAKRARAQMSKWRMRITHHLRSRKTQKHLTRLKRHMEAKRRICTTLWKDQARRDEEMNVDDDTDSEQLEFEELGADEQDELRRELEALRQEEAEYGGRR
ncbi:hypothetical protein WOLCODRAFT_163800 [Wolfiporia cocos MD-104 SS10]|uniref:Uncharacterized protein n=1 Tax=Wolfiporia cocos (strain MD-104) TaxID=742152 RepID=A0A2H3JLR4_WOLCO|nr:hypothetical protein WOLCODRAFT_163800 [Wolfiporia cocos MD-104 SS10]